MRRWRADLERIEALWADGFAQFRRAFPDGRAVLRGRCFLRTVAFRFQTYELPLGADARRYAAQLLALPSMQTWYHAALAETWRDAGHEEEMRHVGTWREDLRAR